MKIRIIGDSHIGALRRAWANGASAEHDLAFAGLGGAHRIHASPAFFEVREGRVYMTKDRVIERVRELMGREYLQPGDPLFGVCMGTHLARIFRSSAWQKFAPWHMASEFGLQPLSGAVLESFFATELQHVLGFFDALHQCGIGFFVLAGPSPRRGHKAMAQRGTSPKIALEVARLYGKYFRAQLARRSYPIIEAPDGVADADGFLMEEYEHRVEGDQHHANAKYGALHIRKMLDELRANVSAGNLRAACSAE